MWAEDAHAQSASGESFLCGSSGCSQSKPPASSCGQRRSNAGWGEKGKKRGRLNSSSPVTGVFWCLVFFCFFSSLPKSLSPPDRGVGPRWHCQMTASVAVRLSRPPRRYCLDSPLKYYFERKLARSKSCAVTPLMLLWLQTVHNRFWLFTSIAIFISVIWRV